MYCIVCYRRKIAFYHCKGYKVNCACAVSRDLYTGGPPKPHIIFLDPELSLLIQLLWATMTIKGSFILEHPMLNRFSAAKKTVQSKSVPEMAVFRKFKDLNIKYSYRTPPLPPPKCVTWGVKLYSLTLSKPPKGTSLPRTTCSDVPSVKIHLGVYAVALLKNPKNEEKTSHPKSTEKSRIWGTETEEPIDTKLCMSSAVHDVITHANFWEDRSRTKGRILAFSIDLLRRL